MGFWCAVAGVVLGFGFGVLTMISIFRSEKSMRAIKRDTEEILVKITTDSSYLYIIDDAIRLIETEDTTLLYIYASGLKALEAREYDRARRCFYAAKEYTSDTTVIIIMLNLIGLTQHKTGNCKDAIETWKEMIDLSEKIRSKGGLSAALNNTFYAYHSLGNKKKALEFRLRILVLYGEITHPYQKAGIDTLEYQEIYSDLVEEQQLKPLPRQLVPIVGGEEPDKIEPEYVRNLLEVYRLCDAGKSLLAEGKYKEARVTFEKMLEVAKNIHWRDAQLYALSYAGIACWEYGDTLNAWYFYRRALKILKRIKDKKAEHRISQAILLHKIGLIYQTWGKSTRALEYYEKAREVAEGTGSTGREIKADQLLNIGMEYIESGNFTEALAYLNKARVEFGNVGSKEMVSHCNLMILYVLEELAEEED